jgi:transcriptional regulator with XRE-family HTH domain
MTPIVSTGERITIYRKEKRLSQQELADLLGVSRGYVGNIESGRNEPSSSFLMLLASKLNVSADWVLTGDGEMLKGKAATIQSSATLDGERLTLAIETVEEGLEVTHRVMKPDKKAELIMAVYDLFKNQDRDRDEKQTKQFMLKLVQSIAA